MDAIHMGSRGDGKGVAVASLGSPRTACGRARLVGLNDVAGARQKSQLRPSAPTTMTTTTTAGAWRLSHASPHDHRSLRSLHLTSHLQAQASNFAALRLIPLPPCWPTAPCRWPSPSAAC